MSHRRHAYINSQQPAHHESGTYVATGETIVGRDNYGREQAYAPAAATAQRQLHLAIDDN